MEYKIYGFKGKPALVFPTSKARFFQFEDEGMIHAVRNFIDEGKVQVWAVDGIDEETFFSDHWDKVRRIHRHEAYFNYINEEMVPSICWKSRQNNCGHDQKLIVTGCSMGAYHAANYFFRYPWLVDSVVALSGVYSTEHFFGDYKPAEIYMNSPIDYLPNNNDAHYLDRFQRSRLIFCSGQGSYEEEMIKESRKLKAVLDAKGIPAWFDFWGRDSVHDWPWWRKQIHYFFSKIL